MKLTSKGRYAVRALLDIAYHAGGGTAQARDVARRQGIPARFLDQIFQDLRRAGLVRSKRGPKGGFTLALDPKDVTIGQVLRAVEGPQALAIPLSGGRKPGSGERSVSPITDTIWKELSEKVAACFDAITFEDLCKKGQALGLARGSTDAYMYFI